MLRCLPEIGSHGDGDSAARRGEGTLGVQQNRQKAKFDLKPPFLTKPKRRRTKHASVHAVGHGGGRTEQATAGVERPAL
jgi:hypothetical protein